MVSRLRLLFWLGIVMLFLPFLGITTTAKMIIAIIIGIFLIVTSIALRRKYRALRIHIRNLEQTVAEQTIHTPNPEVLHE